jgi:uncharacterized lipoprotein YehR (DUF1307 family)
MKKYFLCLLASFLVLVGCSSRSSEEKISTTVATTERVEETTQAITTTEEVVEKTEAYQYEETVEGFKQTIKETLVYKGDKFTRIELHITQEPDEATKASLAGLDYGLVRSQLLEYLEQQPFVQQLRAVPGLELATEVTQDYFIIMNIKIDMSRIDLQALSNVEGVGTDFTELATISPSAYILGLKLKGAVQVQ